MNKLTMNNDNKRYYSEGYIIGWENGVQAQYQADIESMPKSEWIQDPSYIGVSDVPICSNCRKRPPRIECGGKLIGGYGAEATGSVWQSEFKYHRSDFCPNCGADMRGEEE